MLQGLDETKLLTLMIAGGVFALAGLYLLVRPPKGDGETRIEIFGLKFNASSGGLLVFLVGVVMLASPVYVPERPKNMAGVPTASGVPATGETSAPQGDLPLPRIADTKEVEPNDVISTANQIAIGHTIAGALKPGDIDWFVFAPSLGEGDKFRIVFRNLVDGCPQYALMNGAENKVGGEQVCQFDISGATDLYTESDRYYLRVDANGYRTKYEISLSYR